MTEPAAIILAAGRGSRLGAATADAPKCLARVGGRQLLEWQLRAVCEVSIADVYVVGGYRADCLRSDRYQLVVNPLWYRTNVLGSLLCVSALLRTRPCLVIYSDIAFHPTALARLMESQCAIATLYDTEWLALWSARFEDPLEDAETLRISCSSIAEIGGKTTRLESIEGQFMGLVQFDPVGWGLAEATLAGLDAERAVRMDMTGLLALLVAKGIEVGAVPFAGRWCEVDSLRDLALYDRELLQVDTAAKQWKHDWRW